MIYLRLFAAFAKVGILGFGGGLAIVRLIYDSIQPFMEMSQEMFANIVAISQITPGPLAVNTATYVGYFAAGLGGAAAATLGVVLPEFIIMSIVVRMLTRFKDSKWVNGALNGIRPATIGLIGAAAVMLIAPAVAGELSQISIISNSFSSKNLLRLSRRNLRLPSHLSSRFSNPLMHARTCLSLLDAIEALGWESCSMLWIPSATSLCSRRLNWDSTYMTSQTISPCMP